jgi:F0F1-type ATP synthase membrane subunit b/b'
MAERTREDIAEEAARAARKAAEEARTPEARFFLRQHANFLARVAASRRRGSLARRGAVTVLAPLVDALPF